METKTLLPASTMPPMSKIHTDILYGYKNYNREVLLRLQAKNRADELARREYLIRKCLQQNLAFHYPTCDPDEISKLDQVLNFPLKNGDCEITNAKIHLERQLQQEAKSEPKSESDSESESLSELDLDPIPKLDPQPESTLESEPIPKPGSELERKSEVNQESDPKFQAEVQSRLGKKYDIRTLTPSWRLALLAVEDWQQELSSVLDSELKKLELKQLPLKNVDWEMWEKLETANDWFEFLDTVDVLKYRTNAIKLSSEYIKHYRRLSEKSWKKSKIFITKASADRTLSSASIFMKCCKQNENIPRKNLRSVPYPQNGQRSLLRSQQNNMQQNNTSNILPCTNSLANNDNPQLLCNQENNLDQNQNSQNIVTSNNQQRIKEEEDDKESIEEEIQRTLSDFHMTSRNKIIVEVSDEEEELVFQHDHTDLAQQLSEYISEESLKSETSSKTEKKTPNQQKHHWRKNEETQQQDEITRNTLNDHCYHLNEPDPRIVERLRGGEQESDDDDDDDDDDDADDDESVDDEEIDVVSCGKQSSEYFNPAQTLYRCEAGPSTSRAGPSTSRTGPSKSRGKSSQSRAKSSRFTSIAGTSASKLANENNTTVRRPRGRPPGKNSAQQRKNQSRTNQILNHVSTHYVQQTNRQPNIQQNYQQNSPEPNLQQNIQQDENQSRNEAIERRRQHNQMEKQRREVQTKALHDLRGCIPNIANNKRASKVSILAHARDLISELCEMVSINEHTVNSELRRHMYLHSKIAKLKKPVDLKCKVDCFLKRRKEKLMQPCVSLQRV